MKMPARLVQAACLFGLLCSAYSYSQEKPGFSGHWEGILKAAAQDFPVALDLMKSEKGIWIGSIVMGDGKALPLSGVKVEGNSVTLIFPVSSLSMAGKLSEDEKKIIGTALLQGGNTSAFELKRTGEPKVVALPKSSLLAAEFAGGWEGTLEIPDRNLRVTLKLAKAVDGTATGVIDSPDLGAALTVSTITLDGLNIAFDIRVIDCEFKGKLNDARTEITGTWSQEGRPLPLTLKRVKAK
jgi:hypothetical protein